MIHIHRWTCWGDPWVKTITYTWDEVGDMGLTQRRYQDRVCTVCGKRKTRRVR